MIIRQVKVTYKRLSLSIKIKVKVKIIGLLMGLKITATVVRLPRIPYIAFRHSILSSTVSSFERSMLI